MKNLAQPAIWHDHHIYTHTEAKLESIKRDHVNMAVWQRLPDSAMSPIIDWLATTGFALECKAPAEYLSQAVHENISAKSLSPSTQRLIEDIQKLALIFKSYTLARSIRLVIESIHNVPCPKFHQDNLSLRLICTYKGPGTQWLENSNVNTHAHCCGGSIVRDESRIHQLKPFEVALMKGKRWPKNMIGIYHRSPPLAKNEPRLVVKMDVA